MASELLEFKTAKGGSVMGMALNLEEESVGAVILGPFTDIEEGTTVQSSPFFGPISFQTIDQYASGTKLQDWIVVKDLQFTKDNAQQNLANSF